MKGIELIKGALAAVLTLIISRFVSIPLVIILLMIFLGIYLPVKSYFLCSSIASLVCIFFVSFHPLLPTIAFALICSLGIVIGFKMQKSAFAALLLCCFGVLVGGIASAYIFGYIYNINISSFVVNDLPQLMSRISFEKILADLTAPASPNEFNSLIMSQYKEVLTSFYALEPKEITTVFSFPQQEYAIGLNFALNQGTANLLEIGRLISNAFIKDWSNHVLHFICYFCAIAGILMLIVSKLAAKITKTEILQTPKFVDWAVPKPFVHITLLCLFITYFLSYFYPMQFNNTFSVALNITYIIFFIQGISTICFFTKNTRNAFIIVLAVIMSIFFGISFIILIGFFESNLALRKKYLIKRKVSQGIKNHIITFSSNGDIHLYRNDQNEDDISESDKSSQDDDDKNNVDNQDKDK